MHNLPLSINCKGQLISFETPKIMGVLNLTPDSFYDGGKHKDEKGILLHVEKMLNEGATFIDMGAYSSRPGADDISVEEEKKRLLPILEKVLNHFPDALVSIDTFRASIAQEALAYGASMINDISAGKLDDKMLACIADAQVPYIMMHMKGTPQTMKEQCVYENLITEVQFYFSERIAAARALGIRDVLIDLGFGFAKNIQQNYQLLKHLSLFSIHGVPILTGVSRKSMIYKVLENTPQEALNGTSVLNTIALLNGSHLLRVHDVKEANEAIQLVQQLKDS
jgi:dihydropteroate synthase